MHILPRTFVKIRRYGIYNHTTGENPALQFVPKEKPDIEAVINSQQPPETKLQRLERLTGIDPCACPVCINGKMVIVKVLPGIRSPGWISQTPAIA